MKRIMILGAPGSGKSTLARAIGAKLGLPVYHMDLLHWKEDWVERPKSEKIPMARAIEAQEAWVFEGGMSATYQTRIARADVVIWLDLPLALRFWRVNKRLWQNFGRNRPDLPKGCTERVHAQTWIFYRYMWTSRHSARAKVAGLIDQHGAGLEVFHLRSRAEVRAFQRSFDKAPQA